MLFLTHSLHLSCPPHAFSSIFACRASKVFLLQKTPSSLVTCHATGFYPRTSTLFWRKNGEKIHEDVEMGATLPNHDGTFQTSVHLKVEVTPAAEQEYECVFRLAGVTEDIVTKLDAGSILSNARIQEEQDRVKVRAIIVILLAVLAVPLGFLAPVAVMMLVLAECHKIRRENQQQLELAISGEIACKAEEAEYLANAPE
ncbi:major histocompatibility complex class I-related gene protein-like isoform X2 [Syngnathus typhle]|uniref:major histocompatibility complex class I-related gene protein-like isoform X2 n=1 Tax=Syngnathus typhle TaxID=161592 RepID=UPI002A6B5DD0|nr:major histocompatibility complex class I-related gene protein-like isoform X2 [Syngnathus typhle]